MFQREKPILRGAIMIMILKKTMKYIMESVIKKNTYIMEKIYMDMFICKKTLFGFQIQINFYSYCVCVYCTSYNFVGYI